ncbi:MAG: hypothetical protein ACHQRJ_24775 [Alphaproteobacteria bacterium]
MKADSQKRAVANHRRRLAERGMSRYEVRGLNADKEIVRSFAKRLALDDAAAAQLRAEVARKIAGESRRRGHILAALRRSPLVGADLSAERERDGGRDIEL